MDVRQWLAQIQWRAKLWREIWFEDWVSNPHIKRQLQKGSKPTLVYAYVASLVVVLWALLLKQRWLCVLLAGGVSFGILNATVLWVTEGSLTLRAVMQQALLPQSVQGHSGGPAWGYAGAWSLFMAVILAPVAFVLWWFRDTNQLWLIENNRKDTNLKDFQRLSEWATGMHLVEDEVITKTTEPEKRVLTSEQAELASPQEAQEIPTVEVETTAKSSKPQGKGSASPPSSPVAAKAAKPCR
jgi:hypothetical protein